MTVEGICRLTQLYFIELVASPTKGIKASFKLADPSAPAVCGVVEAPISIWGEETTRLFKEFIQSVERDAASVVFSDHAKASSQTKREQGSSAGLSEFLTGTDEVPNL